MFKTLKTQQRKIFFLLLAWGLLMTGTSTGHVASIDPDSALHLQIRPGLAGQRVFGPWAHWEFSAVWDDNPTMAELRVYLGEPEERLEKGTADYVFPLTLAAEEPTVLQLAVPASAARGYADSPFEDVLPDRAAADAFLPITAEVWQGSRLLARQTSVVRDFSPRSTQVLVISRSRSGYNYLRTALDAQVYYVQSAELPEDAAVFRSFDLVIASDTDLSSLRSTQVQALQQWLRAGGQMVVTQAALPDSLQSPLLEAWFSAGIAVGRSFSAATDEMTGPMAVLFNQESPSLTISPLPMVDGQVSVQYKEHPILVHRSVGQGLLHLLNVDPRQVSTAQWAGKTELFAWLLRLGTSPFYQEDWEQDALALAMLQTLPAAPISRLQIFLVLAPLLGGVWVVWKLMARWGGGSLMFMAAAVLLIIGLHIWFSWAWVGRTLVSYQSVVLETAVIRKESQGSDAFFDSTFLLYSHRDPQSEMRMARSKGMLWPLGEQGDPTLRQQMQLQLSPEYWTAQLHSEHLPAVQGLRGQYLGHIPIEVERIAEDAWTVHNSSPAALRKAFLIGSSGYINLFPFEPHSSRTVNPTSRQVQTAAPWVYRQSLWDPIRWRDYLDASMFTRISRWLATVNPERRFLVAALDGPIKPEGVASSGAHLFQGYMIVPWPE